ncbi:hypothetical protein C1H46_008197 [Malus baccata]|uniref:Uncharacterized protein n=1 Tax=Malus baccata TaxID=106549 RepID=A0A540N512_MALBA|nr:hypothetical protein C1H46_008197 [Malus baccata]
MGRGFFFLISSPIPIDDQPQLPTALSLPIFLSHVCFCDWFFPTLLAKTEFQRLSLVSQGKEIVL